MVTLPGSGIRYTDHGESYDVLGVTHGLQRFVVALP